MSGNALANVETCVETFWLKQLGKILICKIFALLFRRVIPVFQYVSLNFLYLFILLAAKLYQKLPGCVEGNFGPVSVPVCHRTVRVSQKFLSDPVWDICIF